MSDLPERYLELIHAEVDEEATDKQLALLREYLASHSEAQEVRAKLVKLTNVLSQVEDVETPGDLRTNIMAALTPGHSAIEIGASRSRFRLRMPLIRYGYALAAGLLIGAALAGVAFKNLSPLEKSDIYGTLAVRENAPRYAAVSQMRLDYPELGGSVELSRSSSNYMIVFNLHAPQAVEVEVGFDGRQAGLVSFNQRPGATRSFEAKEGTISFQSEGNQRSMVILMSDKNAELNFDLRFYVGGKLIHQGTLGARLLGGSSR